MPHKLTFKIQLDREEILSREFFKFTFQITNNNDLSFPGGVFTDLRFKYEGILSRFPSESLPKIPVIEPNESWETDTFTHYSLEPGNFWLEVDISANNEELVKLFNMDQDMGSTWKTTLFIFNKELFRINETLEQVLFELREIKKIKGAPDE